MVCGVASRTAANPNPGRVRKRQQKEWGHASADIVLERKVVASAQRQSSRGAAAVKRMQRNHVSLANRELATLRRPTVSCKIAALIVGQRHDRIPVPTHPSERDRRHAESDELWRAHRFPLSSVAFVRPSDRSLRAPGATMGGCLPHSSLARLWCFHPADPAWSAHSGCAEAGQTRGNIRRKAMPPGPET